MAETRFDLVVVGELNPDLILGGDVAPAFGQVEKLVASADLTIGSSAGIFACGAARLGLRVAFIGLVGDDEFGHFMRVSLAERGVDTQGIYVDPALKTGLSVILSTGHDRAILTYSGTIPRLKMEHIPLDLIAAARHLHMGSYFMLDDLRPQVPALFAQARRLGLTVSLDTNYDPSERWDSGLAEALQHVDVFLPNETECRKIAGQEDLTVALDQLAARVPLLAVKLGKAGAVARRAAEEYHAASIPVQVVDTVGAGDSFDAGFLKGFLSGWDLPACLRLGAVCGALSTTRPGGTHGQPTLAEAQNYLTSNARHKI